MRKSVVLVLLAALAVVANALPLVAETHMPGGTGILTPAGSGVAPGRAELGSFSFPGDDTLRWCDFNSNSSGQTTRGNLAGFGVKLTPAFCPAVFAGAYHRVFKLNTDSAQIQLVADDGPSGAPGSNLCKWDMVVPNYSGQFYFAGIPAPVCTLWSGNFYLFMLGRDQNGGEWNLNWLHDGSLNAPSGTYWRRDSLGNYSQMTPGGDFQMCAVVEYHDVQAESIGGFPANDTVYAESTYQPWLLLHELAGFEEENVPLVLSIGGLQLDTLFAGVDPNGRVRDTLADWQASVPSGTYDCAWYSALRSDTRNSNDTIRFQLTVVSPSGIAQSPNHGGRRGILRLGSNPVLNGSAVFRLVGCGAAGVEADVYSATGRRAFARRLARDDDGCARLDLHSLGSGIYLVRLEADGLKAVSKVIVR